MRKKNWVAFMAPLLAASFIAVGLAHPKVAEGQTASAPIMGAESERTIKVTVRGCQGCTIKVRPCAAPAAAKAEPELLPAPVPVVPETEEHRAERAQKDRQTWFRWGFEGVYRRLSISDGGPTADGLYAILNGRFHLWGPLWFTLEGGLGGAKLDGSNYLSTSEFGGLILALNSLDLALGLQHSIVFQSNGDKLNAAGPEFRLAYQLAHHDLFDLKLVGHLMYGGRAWYPFQEADQYFWHGQPIKDPERVPAYERANIEKVLGQQVDKTGDAWSAGLGLKFEF